MAIFQLLLNSEPNITTLQSVTNIVRQEITNQDPGPRSNQVASYVISLLSSVASNDNPVMKKRYWSHLWQRFYLTSPNISIWSIKLKELSDLMPKLARGSYKSKKEKRVFNNKCNLHGMRSNYWLNNCPEAFCFQTVYMASFWSF